MLPTKLWVHMGSTKCILLIISVIGFMIGDSNSTTTKSVYQVLESYDFPQGLLPKGVTSYEVEESSGKFSVNLNKSCSLTIDGYDLKYKTKISGTISKDKLKNLSGIQVKVLLFWVNIIEVTRDDDELDLSVGIASATFPVDNFYESPQCGCGFDCVFSISHSAGMYIRSN